ncbi:hypothetical protein SCHPADRAFT_946791 [Schizopora paradoxa]|uniref:Uncharacterized protein n=1 Tax=Schizopora paradoxa TaxID=27342 RepID=A0A0H2R1H4_9AGAM|nr:hypothetical protein SCHPADRAFT_946791 [Schizopora paradoxa]
MFLFNSNAAIVDELRSSQAQSVFESVSWRHWRTSRRNGFAFLEDNIGPYFFSLNIVSPSRNVVSNVDAIHHKAQRATGFGLRSLLSLVDFSLFTPKTYHSSLILLAPEKKSMPLRRRQEFCICTLCRENDPDGLGCMLPIETVKMHREREAMGFHEHQGSSRPAQSIEPLVAVFNDMTIGEDAHPAHNLPALTMAESEARAAKKSRLTNGWTAKAMKVLNAVRDETFLLQEQLHNQMESEEGLSLELLVRIENRLETLGIAVDKTTRREPKIVALKISVYENLIALQEKCAAQRVAVPRLRETHPIQFPSDDHMRVASGNYNIVAQIALLLGAVCSIIFGVSRRAGDFVMGSLNVLLGVIFVDQQGTRGTNARGEAILKQIPKKVETASDKFNLKGRLVYYAVCTECKQTHKPIFKPGQAHPTYPKSCNNIVTPGAEPCGALLLERHFVGGLPIWRPVLVCAYHEFNDYVCGLECRDDLRKFLDSSCDDAMEEIRSGAGNHIDNVFCGEFVRNFRWTDGKLFIDRPEGEGRLLFSLNLDSDLLFIGNRFSTRIFVQIRKACLQKTAH